MLMVSHSIHPFQRSNRRKTYFKSTQLFPPLPPPSNPFFTSIGECRAKTTVSFLATLLRLWESGLLVFLPPPVKIGMRRRNQSERVQFYHFKMRFLEKMISIGIQSNFFPFFGWFLTFTDSRWTSQVLGRFEGMEL